MSGVRDMLACASNYPLETAYPMYSWVLSNVMDKYANTPQAAQYVRDLFEGIARGASFFFMVSGSAGDSSLIRSGVIALGKKFMR